MKKPVISRDLYDAVILDMDGVVTQSTSLHARAWQEMFDAYLTGRAKKLDQIFQPFDIQKDYKIYVDGRPRIEGAINFLKSRGIQLPYGSPQDDWRQETICGLANWKNAILHRLLKNEPVKVYESTLVFLDKIREAGFRTALITSSKNAPLIIEKTGIGDKFDTQVDGIRAEKEGLKGKPQPDIFLTALADLGISAKRAIAIEDAYAGIEAAVKGGFGLIIGIDRKERSGADLKKCGADLVVTDLSELKDYESFK